ncbi:MAG: hypothetical protein QXF86_03150 [Candidatus Bilamarchaeaceae archaeon]
MLTEQVKRLLDEGVLVRLTDFQEFQTVYFFNQNKPKKIIKCVMKAIPFDVDEIDYDDFLEEVGNNKGGSNE